MRTLVILILILAALLGFSTWGYYHIENSARSLTRHIDKSEQAVAAGDWSTALREVSSMSSRWKKTKSVWTVFVDHEEMDKIDMTMARVRQVLKTKDRTESRAGLAELNLLIRHIPEKEGLSLHNIL